MAGLTGHRHDFDRSVSDFGDLQREQLAHQVGMSAGERYQRLTRAAGHADDVAPHPVAVLIALAGNLLGRRDDALGGLGFAAHPDDDQAASVGAAVALDHPRDDLALPGGELAVSALVFGIAKSLQHHLTCGGGGDAATTLRSVIPFTD